MRTICAWGVRRLRLAAVPTPPTKTTGARPCSHLAKAGLVLWLAKHHPHLLVSSLVDSSQGGLWAAGTSWLPPKGTICKWGLLWHSQYQAGLISWL